jgi:hypothetical protein
MIEMPLPWLVFSALLIFLAGIFLVWIGYELFKRSQERQRHQNWIRCRLCAFRFQGEVDKDLQICPQCGASNDKGTSGWI